MNKPQETKQKDDNEKIFNWILRITIVLVFVFSFLFISLYCWQFKKQKLTQSQEIFGQFGDYLGGTIGTVATIAAFIATVMIIYLQKKELKETREELKRSGDAQEQHTKLFKQQQFETTFFNLIKLIGETQRNKISYAYSLAIETVKYLIDYKEKTNSDIKKYINIFKPLLDDRTLCDLMVIIKNNDDDKNLKTFVENNTFFEFINALDFNTNNISFVDYKKEKIETLLYFNISAFGENIHYQREVSQSEYVTGNFLDKLLEITKYDEVKINIAGNSKTNPDTLSKLFDNEYHNFEIIVAIAGNSSAPLDILNNICDNIDNIIKNHCDTTKCDKKDHHPRIHNALAKNKIIGETKISMLIDKIRENIDINVVMNLLSNESIYNNKNNIKEILYLFIKYDNFINKQVINYHIKIKENLSTIIDSTLDYLTEYTVNTNQFLNVYNFLDPLSQHIKRTKEIVNKINNTKLNNEDKKRLIEKLKNEDPNQNPNSC